MLLFLASLDTHIANDGSEAEDVSIQTTLQMNDVALRPDIIKKTNQTDTFKYTTTKY